MKKQAIKINSHYRTDEAIVVGALLEDIALTPKQRKHIIERATNLITDIRKQKSKPSLINQLMHHYQLSSNQGLTLMCLAEALLRIPDKQTADLLINDKLTQGDWAALAPKSESMLIKFSDLALNISSKLLGSKNGAKGIAGRGSEPIIRQAVKQAMKLLAKQFILGTDIEQALKNSATFESAGYYFSYDMLGEAAVTAADAERYFQSYKHAINTIARTAQSKEMHKRPSISVKLSALHPRYEFMQYERVMDETVPRVLALAIKCKEANIGLTIDAEEANVLELSLDIFKAVYTNPKLKSWGGLGLAVQAYQKRAPEVIDWLIALAQEHKRKINVRLVKGAYWDTEIKQAQVECLDGYPVFTRKFHTDVCFAACAHKLLKSRDVIYPQFGTHNAYTVATIMELAGTSKGFEFQRLQGMGEELFAQIVGPDKLDIPCRIYAPVGEHNDLLPYLVRRLIENGANTSFVHNLANEKIGIDKLIVDPIEVTKKHGNKPHPRIPLPIDLYQGDRQNFVATDLSDSGQLSPVFKALNKEQSWTSGPIVAGKLRSGKSKQVASPTDHRKVIGTMVESTADDVKQAFDLAHKSFQTWSTTDVSKRSACLNRTADLLEQNLHELMALCIKEAGKTIPDALAEVREAVDFCRYYAKRAQDDFANPKILTGPTGEENQLSYHGRGVFICISPWNFPLAIFMGQVSAALVSGNTVLAKPASSTPLIAAFAVRLLHQAGIPVNALHLLPGDSKHIGTPLLEDPRVAGVALTGSVTTGQIINRTLAQKPGPIVPLIAETGGLNFMFVDSSSLIEQVTKDVLASAFQSAGQRCSALRVLCIQEDIADRCIETIAGAMAELKIGDPKFLATDVGPVIDKGAKSTLDKHITYLRKNAKPVYQALLPKNCAKGTFVAPAAFEIQSLDTLKGEKFGPILHIIRYKASEIEQLIDQVNDLGFGLTLGIHSRVDSRIDLIRRRLKAGNAYVNRNMIGAVVGVQPFGGEGLSGTGPKAGGPDYLHRFTTERTLSTNTMAQGGNAALLTMED